MIQRRSQSLLEVKLAENWKWLACWWLTIHSLEKKHARSTIVLFFVRDKIGCLVWFAECFLYESACQYFFFLPLWSADWFCLIFLAVPNPLFESCVGTILPIWAVDTCIVSPFFICFFPSLFILLLHHPKLPTLYFVLICLSDYVSYRLLLLSNITFFFRFTLLCSFWCPRSSPDLRRTHCHRHSDPLSRITFYPPLFISHSPSFATLAPSPVDGVQQVTHRGSQ